MGEEEEYEYVWQKRFFIFDESSCPDAFAAVVSGNYGDLLITSGSDWANFWVQINDSNFDNHIKGLNKLTDALQEYVAALEEQRKVLNKRQDEEAAE